MPQTLKLMFAPSHIVHCSHGDILYTVQPDSLHPLESEYMTHVLKLLSYVWSSTKFSSGF